MDEDEGKGCDGNPSRLVASTIDVEGMIARPESFCFLISDGTYRKQLWGWMGGLSRGKPSPTARTLSTVI